MDYSRYVEAYTFMLSSLENLSCLRYHHFPNSLFVTDHKSSFVLPYGETVHIHQCHVPLLRRTYKNYHSFLNLILYW